MKSAYERAMERFGSEPVKSLTDEQRAEIASIADKYKAKGLQVVSVSIDKDEESFKGVRELVAQNKIVHPVLMDRYNLLARRYLGDKTSLPAVFLVKGDGTIALVKQGYDGDASAQLTAEVEKLLAN